MQCESGRRYATLPTFSPSEEQEGRHLRNGGPEKVRRRKRLVRSITAHPGCERLNWRKTTFYTSAVRNLANSVE
jgi:hypothetical protein